MNEINAAAHIIPKVGTSNYTTSERACTNLLSSEIESTYQP